jgi:hypothetical protein
MKYRINTNWMKIAVQDSARNTAPSIFVEVDPKDSKRREKAIKEAKERSALSAHGWSFL